MHHYNEWLNYFLTIKKCVQNEMCSSKLFILLEMHMHMNMSSSQYNYIAEYVIYVIAE